MRDPTRRYGLDVELPTQGDFTALPDQYRACISRHSRGSPTASVTLAHARSGSRGLDRLEVSVIDDENRLRSRNRREGWLRGTRASRAPVAPGPPGLGEGTTLDPLVPKVMRGATLACCWLTTMASCAGA
jgi:hypothetical protein